MAAGAARSDRGFDADTNNSIGYLLRDTSRHILADLTTSLGPHGVTLPQYFVLRELWEEEGLTQREVANRVGVLEPTMVTTLDALERRGLIARVRSTTDRRKTHIQLTPEGQTMRDTLQGYSADVLERALAGVSLDEIATAARTLAAHQEESGVTYEWDRLAVVLAFSEQLKMTETYGFSGSQGQTVLEGQRLVPRNRPSDTVFVFMHPASTLQLLPMPTALAAAGYHVLCCGSRYAKNDSALIMEKVVYDLGAYVRYAREELGYRKVVLVGWSGGGSLALFYQAQSEKPTITHTPAGDPYDLTAASLPQVDGVIFIAAHLSRAETLTEWLDPSVVDELDPDRRDEEFDIYSADCPNRPPFSASFVEHFRARQLERNRRITGWVKDTLDFLKRRNDAETERAFVVHRTMCDVRWIDPAIDPNGRKPNWCYLGDPKTVNVGPVGLARFSTLRSWLSQWSYDDSNAKGPKNAANIRHVPVLQIENLADDAVPATHNSIIREALATSDKEYVRIEGATHYYLNQPEQLQQCISALVSWSERKGFLPHGA